MKNIVKAALVAGAIAAAGLGFAGHASAAPSVQTYGGTKGDHDANAYALELMTDGLSSTTNAQAVTIAQAVCAKRTAGTTELAVTEQILAPHPDQFTLASDTVTRAEFHFCPERLANPDASPGGLTEFLAMMHGTQEGTTHLTYVMVPGGDTELVSLAKVACTADAQGLVGRDVAAKVRAAEPQIKFGQKDPKYLVDDPAIHLENNALSYVCP
jgi:hypothetical protein